MMIASILGQEIVEAQLRAAQQQVEQNGVLEPVLYVCIAGGKTLEMPLELPDTIEEKTRHFWEIGSYLHERNLQPREAVLVSEGWIVNAQEAPMAMDFPPSEHPARQEAIVIIGRSADNRRYSYVIQPFTRDKANKPIWQPMPIASYDELQVPGEGNGGLLDFFFEAATMHQR